MAVLCTTVPVLYCAYGTSKSRTTVRRTYRYGTVRMLLMQRTELCFALLFPVILLWIRAFMSSFPEIDKLSRKSAHRDSGYEEPFYKW